MPDNHGVLWEALRIFCDDSMPGDVKQVTVGGKRSVSSDNDMFFQHIVANLATALTSDPLKLAQAYRVPHGYCQPSEASY